MIPRLVLAAAHLIILAEVAIKPAKNNETPSDKMRNTLVSSVELAAEGANQPKLLVVEETLHAKVRVKVSHINTIDARSHAGLFCVNGCCRGRAVVAEFLEFSRFAGVELSIWLSMLETCVSGDWKYGNPPII